RQRDRRRHGLWTGAGESRVDLDGGEVDRRQIRHRQRTVRHRAEDHDAQHHERRRDGALDEELGKIHGATCAASSPLMLTWLPATSRRWPSVTTVSDGLSPLLTTVSRPAVRSTTTGRYSTVLSAFTTYAYWPC